jgi:hypothetical protein
MNQCCTHGTSNAFIIELLGLLSKNILPQPNTLPSTKYEASKTMKWLGLAYNVIDVYVNGCILFQGNYVNVDQCIKCGENRYWKVGKSTMTHKVLQHFLLIPCLQWMFSISKIDGLALVQP